MAATRPEKRVILDTSILLRWWNRCLSKHRGALSAANVKAWACDLIELLQTKAIVTPVFVEIIGGAMNRTQLTLSRAFLGEFECIDGRYIPEEDWEETIRLAQRAGRSKRPRDLGDCLIRAIANRLKHDVYTHDQDFPK